MPHLYEYFETVISVFALTRMLAVQCKQRGVRISLCWLRVGEALENHYTGCPRRNVPDFGRVFLMLKYTDITQNTYVQSLTVTEIKAREKCGLLAVPRTVPGSRDVIPIRCALSVPVYSRLKPFPAATAHVKCLVTLRTTMT